MRDVDFAFQTEGFTDLQARRQCYRRQHLITALCPSNNIFLYIDERIFVFAISLIIRLTVMYILHIEYVKCAC